MLTLGIETSCDETAVALYHPQRGLLAERVRSQAELHAPYGGVIPELAARDHQAALPPLWRACLQEAGAEPGDIEAIGCTLGPGLIGALRTGWCFAQGVRLALGCPLVGVHHMEGHLLAPMLSQQAPPFPHLALLVSGGHSLLVRVDGLGRYRILGRSLDDAAGEAFDKVARMLGLGYPGGPEIARAAGDLPGDIDLPRPMLDKGLDFSFAGLKTAVMYQLRGLGVREGQAPGKELRARMAASFQRAAVDVLAVKAQRALRQEGLRHLVAGGGVACNSLLRERLGRDCEGLDAQLWLPPLRHCTDNAAMIALAASVRLQANAKLAQDGTAQPRPRWPLDQLQPL